MEINSIDRFYAFFLSLLSGTSGPTVLAWIFFSSFLWALFFLWAIFLSAFSASFFSVFLRNVAFLAAFRVAFSWRILSCRAFLVFLGSTGDISGRESGFGVRVSMGLWVEIIYLFFRCFCLFRSRDSFRLLSVPTVRTPRLYRLPWCGVW